MEIRQDVFRDTLNAVRGDGSMPLSTGYDGPSGDDKKFEGDYSHGGD